MEAGTLYAPGAPGLQAELLSPDSILLSPQRPAQPCIFPNTYTHCPVEGSTRLEVLFHYAVLCSAVATSHLNI